MTRLLASILAIALLGGCSMSEEGNAVASPQPPQDIWQLADQLVGLVPPTADGFANMLGTPLTPNQENPLRLEGGAVQLSPTLRVTDSVIAIIGGTWSFAAINVEPTPCITEDMVQAHYPTATITRFPTGHSPMEEYVWSVPRDWGELTFGIREQNRCLAGISIQRDKL